MQVPKGYCQCGCGQKVKEGCRFIHGHNRRGIHHSFSIQSRKRMSVGQLNRFSNPENHPRWKGGEIRHRGYMDKSYWTSESKPAWLCQKSISRC